MEKQNERMAEKKGRISRHLRQERGEKGVKERMRKEDKNERMEK